MKFRNLIVLLTLFLTLTPIKTEDNFEDEEFDEEDHEDNFEEEEGLEDDAIHEENEANPARQTVDVDVPMPNHEIKNSFVVNLVAGELLDIQAMNPTIDIPKDENQHGGQHEDLEEEVEELDKKIKKHKKKSVKKKKQKVVKKRLV